MYLNILIIVMLIWKFYQKKIFVILFYVIYLIFSLMIKIIIILDQELSNK